MKRILRAALSLGIVLFSCSFVIAQTTVNVPADAPTIQAAITVAQNGDTVLVAPGTYTENLDFAGKAITLKSSDGPQVTILDGGAKAPVVQFVSGEGLLSVLDGFTIRNGYQAYGSGLGIKINGSSPTIQNNVVTENIGCNASAIYSNGGSPLIQNNTISNNGQMTQGCGGGMGAGIRLGGQQSAATQARIVGNTITNNVQFGGSGGAIALNAAGNAVVANNIIRGNSAYDTGGIYVANSSRETIAGNLIVENSGINLYLSVPYNAPGVTAVNNTIVTLPNNSSAALYVVGYFTSSRLANNLVIGQSASAPFYCSPIYTNLPPAVNNNNASSTLSANAYDGLCAGMNGVAGNTSFDPLFMDFAHGNYHLQNRSGAVDAGDSSVPGIPDKDIDGNARILDGNNHGTAFVDIGAYEFVPGQTPSGYAALAPATTDFGQVTAGQTSEARIFTLTNTGTGDLNISGVSATAPFSVLVSDCPAILGPGLSCSINVTFSPTTFSRSSGLLTVSSDASNGAATAVLTGLGVPPGPVFSPNPVDFGAVLVNTAGLQNASLQNNSSVTLTISDIALTGPFAKVVGGCSIGTVLAPGGTCGMGLIFRPSATGPSNGYISVTTNPASGPSVSTLMGTGVAPAIAVDKTSLAFGNQFLNTTSDVQTVTISNTGTSLLNFYHFSISSGFTQTNNCGSSLAPGASCTFNVTFTPTAAQTYAGTLSIYNNSGSNNTITAISLSGTGAVPAITVNPLSLSFGTQLLGTTSAAKTIQITNTGNLTQNISSITISGSFQQTNTCTGNLAPNSSCSVAVTYSPSARATDTGTVTITHDAPNSPAIIALSGTGVAPIVKLSPASVNFGDQLVATTSTAQTITLSNTGDAALQISSVTVTAPFTQTNNCGSTVTAGASCSINVSFLPTTRGTASANLSVIVASPAASQSVPVTGNGVAPVLSVSPSSIGFGTQLIGTTSAAQTVTITNTGDAALSFAGFNIGAPFTAVPTCSSTLAAGASCNVAITFSPIAHGQNTSSLSIQVTEPAVSQTVSVTGTGIAPEISLSASNLNFSSQAVNTTSSTQVITVTNAGDGPMSLFGISVSAPFSQSNNCASTLTAGASCVVTVTFTPAARLTYSGTLAISDSASGSPHVVALTGTGIAPVAMLSVNSLNFGSQPTNTTASAQSFTLSNSGELPLNISAITVTGNFARSSNCPPSLAPGNGCTVTVAFSPVVLGLQSGVLTIIDDDLSGSQTVSLSGSGVDFALAASPSSVSVARGGSVSINVAVNPLGGPFSYGVALSCTGVPKGTTCSLSPNSVTPGASGALAMLTIVTPRNTSTGTYTITVTGVAGTQQHATAMSLAITK